MTKYLVSHPDLNSTPTRLTLAGVKNLVHFEDSNGFSLWLAELTINQKTDLILRGCYLRELNLHQGMKEQVDLFFARIAYNALVI